ncbi:signal peptidase I [Halalkalicoccus tibetensis]|uniref:Signal peptidase I n=1 Tax=Halalkalicoccus tibetensis TaxID=175632 RepID=A0ABD5V8M5_9EURY
MLLPLIGGGLLGQPIGLGFVETGSMEPTIDAGDGFVAVPGLLSGEVEEGDVIVFEATNVQGGEVTTHRIVGETDHGYITQGDANPFSDQSQGEPPVTDGQILATALQIGTTVVVIPHLGTMVLFMSNILTSMSAVLSQLLGRPIPGGAAGLGYLFIGLGAVVLAVTILRGEDRTRRFRSRSRSRRGVLSRRRLVVLIVIVVSMPLVAGMAIPSGVHEYGIVSAERDSPASHVIEAGETSRDTHTVPNTGVVPTVVVTEPASEGIAVDRSVTHLGARTSADVTVEIEAPPETGYYYRHLAEYHYPIVLPPSLLIALHGIHPLVAGSAILATAAGIPALVAYLVLEPGRYRTRSRSR